ncbi:hypothetical protein BH11BAC2_BH11BAC2_18420 [soil metagenome]
MGMLYLTYAEPPSGVYSSQVVDVVRYVNDKLDAKIRLVAFISLHDFKKNKTAILKQLPDAIILPMLPKATYWKLNTVMLWFITLFTMPKVIISRNVIATNMALAIRGKSSVRKVCFDGRGAIAAEWKEYDVKVVESWKKEIDQLEEKAVNQSNFRIAVSSMLVAWWRKQYNYKSNDHVVIPCTLNSSFKAITPSIQDVKMSREKLGLMSSDIVMAYSGSTAGWQSFSILQPFLSHYLKQGKNYKVIFLAQEEENIQQLEKEFPGQVSRKWVPHQEVPSVLSACDLGILIREKSITNEVASPTKFAEYLSAGLPVIISENLGDYSVFVKNHHCGYVLNGHGYPLLEATSNEKRAAMIQLVEQYCTKDAHLDSYRTLKESLLN